MNKTYIVNGMSCVICKNTVEKTLKSLHGVYECKVNLLENEAYVDFDSRIVSEKQMVKALADAGYELVIQKQNKVDIEKIKLIVSIILVLVLMYFSMGSMLHLNVTKYSKYYQLVLCTIILILNIRRFKSGFASLKHLNPNMDFLVSLSSLVSYLYSIYVMDNPDYHIYFETSAMILVIVSIGKYIEGSNKNKAVKTIRGLATLIPMQANLIVGDKTVVTKIDNIKVDDIVIVLPGESIPQDGVVISGSSNVDESMITGESIPQLKKLNDNVIGGTVNINGELKVKITKNNVQTTLAKIISLTKQATMEKIPIERFADTISKYFVFTILTISILTFVIWYLTTNDIEKALNFSLCVLVIACPCALGLATPSAIAVATGVGASHGILIKKPEILEIAYKIKNIILDKTGTLTKNKLDIIDVKKYDEEFDNAIASLEKLSSHPIANSIKERYNKATIYFDHFEQVSGQGVIGKINNDVYFAGNQKLIDRYLSNYEKYDIENALLCNYSYIAVGKNDKLLGVVYLSDVLRSSTKQAISNLKARDIKPIMATGDNQIVADKIARILDLNEYYASMVPNDKSKLVKQKKEEGYVGMVGDGINDAIALSSADVSISLSNGTDIAYATSDVILMSNSIDDICLLVDLSKKTMTIIKQNLFWALFYNSICIPVAAGCLYNWLGISLNPMLGAIAMCISSIFVLTNSLRINSLKKGGNVDDE